MNRGNRRRRKKRVTGRFFGFLAIIIIAVIIIVAFAVSRNKAAPTVGAENVSNAQQTTAEQNATDAQTQNSGNDEWESFNVEDSGLLDKSDLEALTEANTITIADNDLSLNTSLSSDWLNVLLLGSDTRVMSKNSRTDTIMIASINLKDGRIKLTSLMRDMWIEVPQRNTSEKINNLAYYGGPQLAMKRINELLSMNIEKYVMVNFLGMQEAVDVLGGIKLDITEDEMNEINKTIVSQLKATTDMTTEDWRRDGDKYKLATFGKDTQLDGLQAVAFARIRAIGNGDYDRTNRQQRVMAALLETVKTNVTATNVAKLLPTLWDNLATNYTQLEIAQLAITLIRNGLNADIQSLRIPESGTYVQEQRGGGVSALYDVNFEKNTTSLHNFIYN